MIRKNLIKESQPAISRTGKIAGGTKKSSEKAFDAVVLGKNKDKKTATGIDYSKKISDVPVYRPFSGRKKTDI
ncbi:hypothetical protein MmiAt1_17310 [Methanimicrococcus sp. At1]|uniref:Uncharacterized protein n=2 Tax=Methanimicrococcus hacksteinii TaxID=3028293 RepID=A0ABU3VRT1_9EURY|nr:hypothetical protein [Methanimicrococcus sp. At1]